MALRSALINVMWGAAGKAARVLVRDFGEIQQLQTSARGPDRFAAAAVRRAAGILRQELVRARPAFGYRDPDGLLGAASEERWLVEPLDGGTNYLHAIPHFAMALCAVRRGETIAAIIYDPLRDELFWADRGQGAYLNEHRLRVSARRGPAVLGLPASESAEATARLAQLIGANGPRRTLGATALDLAYVAAGRFEGCLWLESETAVTAAGAMLVREAGGFTSETMLGWPDAAQVGLAANAVLFPEFARLLGAAGSAAAPPRWRPTEGGGTLTVGD